MNIKLLHASFLITTGDYCNERIGFTFELEEGDTVEECVGELRQKAIAIVGSKAKELYDEKWKLEQACKKLTKELFSLREEWQKTADFLKAQGINPNAPSMPQFGKLLASAVEEESVSSAEIVDDCF